MKKDNYEQVQATRTADRALRRRRKHRGIRHLISQGIRRVLRSAPAK